MLGTLFSISEEKDRFEQFTARKISDSPHRSRCGLPQEVLCIDLNSSSNGAIIVEELDCFMAHSFLIDSKFRGNIKTKAEMSSKGLGYMLLDHLKRIRRGAYRRSR